MRRRETKFGKLLWKLRMERQESLSAIAASIGVSPAIISGVEVGDRPASENLTAALVAHFGLHGEDADTFWDRARQTRDRLELNMRGAGEEQQETAVVFARRFSELPEHTLAQIKKLLEPGD